ncbi:MAG: isocitrate/isopropylmalate dehydrogenase family protein [Candidatus Coatesbacteria bacterium]|nr:isocitrate/isopropylmalate dehydrogenase family protein [Candidatus Coatesbacteria bacterium]
MAKHRIAYLPGDGIGVDVLEAARTVLDALKFEAEYIHGDVGWEFWCDEGNPLPDRTIEVLKDTDCCIFGAITSKPHDEAARELAPHLWGQGFTYFSPIVRLRQLFNLHTNLRPCRAFKGNPLNLRDDIDLVVFRENTEGLYSGVELHPVPREVMRFLADYQPKARRFIHVEPDDLAISVRVYTRAACHSIVKQAFEFANKNGYPTVTVVEKPNVLRETGGLLISEARRVADEYPNVELWEANIDAMCMWLVKNPQNYGVLCAGNMFGDIISDLAAQIVGGLGFAASANVGDNYALFEPTHGSAPKYVGMNKVNPMAAILSAKLMLEYLGEKEKALTLEQAIERVISEGNVRTYDMGGKATTTDVANEVAKYCR